MNRVQKKLIVAAVSGVVATLAGQVKAITYNYTAPTASQTDQWSAGTNWDTTPVSDSTTSLTFTGAPVASEATISNNDIASPPFQLNNLTFTASGPAAGTAPAYLISGNALQFVNDGVTGPTMTIGPTGTIKPTLTISNNISLGADLSITATTDATLSGVISGSGNTLTKAGAGTLYLTGVSNTLGSVAINVGTITLNVDALASSSSVTVASGATLARTTGVTLNNLSGSGNLTTSAGGMTVTLNNTTNTLFGGSLNSNTTNASDLVKIGAGTFTQQGKYSSKNNLMSIIAGTYVISGGGSFVQSNNARGLVSQGAALTLDNSVTNASDRVKFSVGSSGDGAGDCFQLNGGTVNFIGNASANSSQSFGTEGQTAYSINFGAGSDVFALTPGASKSAIVSFGGNSSVRASVYYRAAGASILIKGTGIGKSAQNALAPDSSNFVFSGTYSSATVPRSGSVRPGVIIDRVTSGVDSYGLATYDYGPDGVFGNDDDTGFRTLKNGEVSTMLTSETNVKLTTSAANSTMTINSLHLVNGGNITEAGSQTLTVSTGTILSTGTANAIGGSSSTDILAFGGTEAVFYNAPSSTLTVNTKITGSGGLTKGGDGTLVLANTATSQYTGTTIINGGILSAGANGSLGTITTGSSIALNNGGVLQATGTFSMDNGATAKRNIVVGGTVANTITRGGIDVTAGNTLTVSGIVSGVGRLNKTGNGTVLLSAANTYAGGTTITGGTLQVDGVGTLGTGAVVLDGNGSLVINGTANVISDTALLTLTNTAVDLNLATGVNESVGALSLGGVMQVVASPTTFGSTLSGAMKPDDSYFSGTGVITVVPEPTSLSLLGLAGFGLLARRRRQA